MGCIQKTTRHKQKQGQQNSQQPTHLSLQPILKVESIDESSNKIKKQANSQSRNIYEQAFQNEVLLILMRVEPQQYVHKGRSSRKSSTTISPVQGILKNSNLSPQQIGNKKKQRVNFSTGCKFYIKQNLSLKSKSLCKDRQY
ncbi:hypothetical protein pb186bvf_016092 [Paramecium bursaria]